MRFRSSEASKQYRRLAITGDSRPERQERGQKYREMRVVIGEVIYSPSVLPSDVSPAATVRCEMQHLVEQLYSQMQSWMRSKALEVPSS